VNLTSGLVTAKSPGIVHITATAINGTTGTFATFGALGEDEAGDLLDDGQYEYTMRKVHFIRMLNERVLARRVGDPPERAELTALSSFLASTCAVDRSRTAWWSSGRSGGYVDAAGTKV
jgi:hypothetical protein